MTKTIVKGAFSGMKKMAQTILNMAYLHRTNSCYCK
jgi:hypothetical protein